MGKKLRAIAGLIGVIGLATVAVVAIVRFLPGGEPPDPAIGRAYVVTTALVELEGVTIINSGKAIAIDWGTTADSPDGQLAVSLNGVYLGATVSNSDDLAVRTDAMICTYEDHVDVAYEDGCGDDAESEHPGVIVIPVDGNAAGTVTLSYDGSAETRRAAKVALSTPYVDTFAGPARTWRGVTEPLSAVAAVGTEDPSRYRPAWTTPGPGVQAGMMTVQESGARRNKGPVLDAAFGVFDDQEIASRDQAIVAGAGALLGAVIWPLFMAVGAVFRRRPAASIATTVPAAPPPLPARAGSSLIGALVVIVALVTGRRRP